MGAFMGMAGIDGMLRRHMYVQGEFAGYMFLAAICGLMLLAAWIIFMYNLIATVGIKGLLGIFTSSNIDEKIVVPEVAPVAASSAEATPPNTPAKKKDE